MEYCTGLFEADPLSELPCDIMLLLFSKLFISPAAPKTSNFQLEQRATFPFSSAHLGDNPNARDFLTASSL
jgi:hypothetical protein